MTLALISKKARERQIVRSPEQSKLSRKFLSPAVVGELLPLTQRYRSEVDREFREQRAKKARGAGATPGTPGLVAPAASLVPVVGESFPEQYPLGHCGQIRDAVWKRLAGTPLVTRLLQQGLIWKKIYFIQDGCYFQNAIQCGDWLLDPANDTVSLAESPVALTPLGDLAYENIDDWNRYAEVAEIYYQLRVYPNFYFPLIFPLAPFLAVRSSGRVDLLLHQDILFLLDLGEGMHRGRGLLADQRWMERRLPPFCEAALENYCDANQAFPLEFRKCSIADLHQALGEWNQLSTLPPTTVAATITQLWEIGRNAARLLRLADIRCSFPVG